MQQSDPLGPLLFCLTIHPIVECLQSRFRVFYHDDGVLGGSLFEVQEDILSIESNDLGLELNTAKSEIVTKDPTTRASVCRVFLDIVPVKSTDAILLGVTYWQRLIY